MDLTEGERRHRVGTKGYKNALLSAFIVALLLTSAALPILGWTSLTSASPTPNAKTKLEGFDKTAGKWSTGNLTGWKELDWVPYRIKFRDLPEGTSSYTFNVYHNNLLDDKDGVDRLRDFHVGDEDGNPVTGSVTVSGPFYKIYGKGDQDIYYAITVRFENLTPGLTRCLYWQAHLAFGASGWPGSSLHAYADISGKGSVSINVPPTPVGSISGYKWNDLNCDGSWSLDEPELSGWTIQLYSFDPVENTWNHLADINTDSAGAYTFALVEGNYRLCEVLKDNWTQTFPPSGCHEIVISEGEKRGNINFGNFFLAMRNVEVSISPRYREGLPGGTVKYTVNVWNMGSIADTYDLGVSDNAGWGLTLSDNLLSLSAGQKGTVTLSVTIPEDAAPSTEDNIKVTATSQGDPNVSDFDTCIAHATEAVAPSTPTLKSPANGTITNDNTPTFEWTVGSNADNHQLLVDNDPDFTSPIENRLFGSTDNTYTPVLENSLPDDNYSWKVIAINLLGENQSPVWTFVIDTVPPAAPSLGSPADGTITDDNTPTFDWSDVIGAENYDLLVDDDPDFSSPEIQVTVSVSTYTPTVELPDENYSWKVRARDAASNVGDWSSVWTLIIKTIVRGVEVSISPGSKSGAPGETLTYTVTVTNIGNVPDNYTLTVSDNLGWGPTVSPISLTVPAGENKTATLSVTVPEGAVPSTDDNITVTATSQGDPNMSNFDTCIAHVTEAVAPSAPTLKSPADGTITNDNTPTFEWTVGANAENHRLLVDNDPNFASPEENVLLGSTDNTYTPVLENSLPDDNYSWKVIAINLLGENQSPVWTFVIDTIPPGAPSWGSPPDGTITDDNTPTFDWPDVPDAENYDFLIDGIQVTISVSTYTLTVELLDGSYSWKVRARDAAGNVSDWSSTWTLIIKTIVRGVEVSISPWSKSEAPGETLSYAVTVTNTGNVEDTYDLAASDTDVPSWNPTVSPTSLTIAAGGSKTATLSVTIPSDASSGTKHTITVTAKSTEDPAVSDSASCTAQATVQMGVEVSISPDSKSGPPEETLTYNVTVKNTGSIDDTYTLSAVGAEGWSVSIEPTSLILAAGATGEATLRVVVPPDAVENDSMTVTVSATSMAYPSVTDSDTCETIVKGAPVVPGVGLALLLAILAFLIIAAILLLAYLLRRRRRGVARRRVLRDVCLGLGAALLAMIYLLAGRRRAARRRVFNDASPGPRRWIGDRDC